MDKLLAAPAGDDLVSGLPLTLHAVQAGAGKGAHYALYDNGKRVGSFALRAKKPGTYKFELRLESLDIDRPGGRCSRTDYTTRLVIDDGSGAAVPVEARVEWECRGRYLRTRG